MPQIHSVCHASRAIRHFFGFYHDAGQTTSQHLVPYSNSGTHPVSLILYVK